MAEPWVELRVHGVSGTPPEDMLDIDRVRQVAGDEFGRVFRRADRRGVELAPVNGHTVEAYHWGQLTSGSWVQALWLLLAPFGLVNAAQFALERPTSRTSTVSHAVAGAMLRLIGLTLTVLFVLTAAIITLDLWVWQQAGATGGLPYALALGGPVALLAVYLLLAGSRPAVNEITAARDASRPVPSVQHSDLVRPGFFEGDPDAPALKRMHLAAGLLFAAVVGFGSHANEAHPAGLLGFRIALGLSIVVGVVVVLLGDPERSAGIDWQQPDEKSMTYRFHENAKRVGDVLVALAVVVFVVAFAQLWAVPPDRPAGAVPVHVPGIDWASYSVMLVAVAAAVVLAVANGVVAICERGSDLRSRRPFGPYAKGMGCTLIASIGVFLGVGYVGAFTTALAGTMTSKQHPVLVPELLARVVYSWGLTAVGLVVIGLLAVARRRLCRRRLRERAHQDMCRFDAAGEPRLHVPQRWVRRIATAIWSARLKNSVVFVVTTFAGIGAVLTAFVLYELWPQLTPPSSWPQLNPTPQEPAGWLAWISASAHWPFELGQEAGGLRAAVIGFGTLTLTGLATVLVFVGRTALLGEASRRSVNVVWDVIAFWPRSAHPFVPAAYSQRAVTDLEHRIRHLDRPQEPGRRLVLCAHSQGSLLAFAALLRIAASPLKQDEGRLDRIGLVTFGSQLQVMFARGFPAYVNREAIGHLFEQLGGAWRNLYRDTDYLAGPVLSWGHRTEPGWIARAGPVTAASVPPIGPEGRQEFGPDWRLLDPPIPTDPDLQDDRLIELRRHGDYWRDDAWDAVLAAARDHPDQPEPEPEAVETCSCEVDRQGGRREPAATAITPEDA